MSLSKTKGVVLRTINVGEADRILEIFTDDRGKLRAVARGVRKIRSKLAGHLEPFTYVDLLLAKGKGDLPVIAGAKALSHYQGIRTDLDRVAVASYLSELVGKLNADEDVSRQVLSLVRAAFSALEGGYEPRLVADYYQWQAITLAGLRPDLYACVECGRKLFPNELAFSPGLGGVLCKECVAVDAEAIAVSPEAIKLLRAFTERPFAEASGILVRAPVRKEVSNLLERLVHHHLEREPKSRRFLDLVGK
ncbi:MAG: DNA repair protein RecO [bacterium]|nr:DNA repair protein RecO [bacterium]MDZ4248345.1 DNA repair protein RecO [Patescibacteria group bacterium]